MRYLHADGTSPSGLPHDMATDVAAPLLELALWVMSTETKVLRAMPPSSLIQADQSLSAAYDWLDVWSQVVAHAKKRVKAQLSDNLVILDTHRVR